MVRCSPWASCSGLSPRVRGNPAGPLSAPDGLGSIPACAGEPPPRPPLHFLSTVYPRVCGGTRRYHDPGFDFCGLSPRVRGNPVALTAPVESRRSIPACAGEPPGILPAIGRRQVYPRVCGGTFTAMGDTLTGLGLSPRVRGNRSPLRPSRPRRRSIPACAGEPGTARFCPDLGEVYPRVCGGTG